MLGLQREGLVLKLQEVAAENDRLLQQCCNTQVTQGMLCDIALWCAQIKEDGMKTEALAELIAMTQQLTNQVKHGSGLLSHV